MRKTGRRQKGTIDFRTSLTWRPVFEDARGLGLSSVQKTLLLSRKRMLDLGGAKHSSAPFQ